MLAVMNGHRDSVMLLLDQAANPNAVDVNGRTSAHRGVSIQFSFYSRHFTHLPFYPAFFWMDAYLLK